MRKLKGLKSLDICRGDLIAGDLAGAEELTEIWCGNSPEELLTIVKDPKMLTVMGCYWTSSIEKIDLFENLEHLYIENPGYQFYESVWKCGMHFRDTGTGNVGYQ